MKTPRGDHGSKTYSHRPRQLTRDYRIRWGWLGLGGWIETCAPDHCSWSCGTGLRWNDIRFYAGDFVVAVLMLCRRAHSKCTGEECVSVCVFDWFLFATNEIDLDMRICSPLSAFSDYWKKKKLSMNTLDFYNGHRTNICESVRNKVMDWWLWPTTYKYLWLHTIIRASSEPVWQTLGNIIGLTQIMGVLSKWSFMRWILFLNTLTIIIRAMIGRLSGDDKSLEKMRSLLFFYALRMCIRLNRYANMELSIFVIYCSFLSKRCHL